MKIQVLDSETSRPLANTKIQLQVKGQSSGLLTFTTDAKGFFDLDDKFKGQQIAFTSKGSTGQFITATDGALLKTTLRESIK